MYLASFQQKPKPIGRRPGNLLGKALASAAEARSSTASYGDLRTTSAAPAHNSRFDGSS